MRSLEVDERWGLPCVGYHVQARPDRDAITTLRRLQQTIMQASPVALNLIPADALHLSVATLVPAQPPSELAEKQWSRIQRDASRELAALPSEEVSIIFRSLAFTRHALVLVTRDQAATLLRARSRFGDLLTSHGIKYLEYNQAHITIARYAESITLDERAFRSTESTELAIKVEFEPSRLIRELRYPSLQVEVVQGPSLDDLSVLAGRL
jgi:hypothetical protein